MASKRFLVSCILVLFVMGLHAQGDRKKAVKLEAKAEEALRSRNFEEAIELLQKAIQSDSTYGKAYTRLAGVYHLYGKPVQSAATYNLMARTLTPEAIEGKVWARIAEVNYDLANYTLAKEAIDHVPDPDTLLLASILFSQKSLREKIRLEMEELPAEINAYRMQYFPVLTVDERTMIYTKMDHHTNEDLVVSYQIGGAWIPAQPLAANINTPYNEGACSISADGRTLIFTSCEGRPSFGSCDLYISRREGNQWSKPENLGPVVNSRYWDSQPAVSADGRTLYFASNRPGGEGSRDIWVTWLKNGQWKEPVNLGSAINTRLDETTPFIHANNTSLFFSSKGHPGLGGFDLFVAEKEGATWGKPKNLGSPVNSHHDEISLFINASGSYGYFALEDKSDPSGMPTSKIVRFRIPFDSLLVNHSSYVVGTVRDAVTGAPLQCTLQMTNLNDSSDYYRVTSDSVSGKYFLTLTQGREYGVFISRKHYLFEDLTFQAKENSVLRPDTIDIYLQPVQPGETVILENVYFEFDDYSLSAKSRSELDQLAQYIKEHRHLKFEIQGHTDNVGSGEYNLELSKKRARCVFYYLVEEGVASSQLTFHGYGATQPITGNDSESGRRMNRRISFVVLSEN